MKNTNTYLQLIVLIILVVEGLSFREAYQQIGAQVQKGTYKPDMDKQHSHIGSIHNLCLDKIKDKYP